jgi:DNA-binding transcriptional LysR family regulator
MDLAHLTSLSIGIIDDFDDNLTPRLATILADNLTGCQFKMITASSHDIRDALLDKRLHLGIAAQSSDHLAGILEYPQARDPFILVTPRDVSIDLKDNSGTLPFLRYEAEQLISRQIEGYLTRHKIVLTERFEIGSHLALMAMVARGIGWTITTPLGYMRAGRFHDQIAAQALPDSSFARQISLFADADWAGDVSLDMARTMRNLIQSHMIDPALVQLPWLAGALRILEDGPTG